MNIPLSGRTYTLTDPWGNSSGYYHLVRDAADRCLEIVPDERALRSAIRAASTWRAILPGNVPRRSGMAAVLHVLEENMSPFLAGIEEHLEHLSLRDRMDRTLRTGRKGYLLSMLEIELTNRINAEPFLHAAWKMALIAHCLRDFRDSCRSLSGEVEERCAGCDDECVLHGASRLAGRYGVHPYISVSMDHRRLLREIRRAHPGMGVLGIACIPELAAGLRLCDRLGIPAVGVPLDANRCSRWFGQCLETGFNLNEMERILRKVPGSW